MNIPSKKTRGYNIPALFLICMLFYLQLVSEIKHVPVAGAVRSSVKQGIIHNDSSGNLIRIPDPADSGRLAVSASIH
ncbi:MAG: hypothetical protein C5B52_03840 [Bacteroidetes bacterium]|nr:MAG: hypothetical protein C5B52_03840 [Bacteroidota bacterium]